MFSNKFVRSVILAIILSLIPSAAYAHDGSPVPFGGFLSGLVHPVLGYDHLLAMLSVGILSAQIGGRAIWTVPATFVAVMAIGGGLAEKDGWASREETEKWIDFALTFMRDLAVLKITGRRDLLINIDLGDSIERLGKSVEPQRIIDMYKELNFIRAMLLFNLNKSLTWNYTAVLLRKELVSQND